MANDNKLTIGLVVVVGLVALVAIVISAVSLAKAMPPTVTVNNPSSSGGAPSGSQGQGQGQGQGGQQPIIVQVPASAAGSMGRYTPPMGSSGRIYSLYTSIGYGSHGYKDDAGYMSGFGVGLIDLVCEAAEIDCRLTWALVTTCWDSKAGQHAIGGKGLHDRWFDGCVGWYITVERSHVFQFSQAYLKAPTTNFFILNGKSFDTSKSNILNSKIVFINAWASDEKCMARQTGAIMRTPNIIYAKTAAQAMSLLNNGYDAIFATHTTFRAQVAQGILQIAGPGYSCMIAGNGVMARKDNDAIITDWNRGFMKVKSNGRFKKYCETANAEHIEKGTVECIDSY